MRLDASTITSTYEYKVKTSYSIASAFRSTRNMTMDISGKRILITQAYLFNYAGSEVATLELSNALSRMGADVTIFTTFFGSPIDKHFKNMKVVTDPSELSMEDFDLVWAHHQLIPSSFLDSIGQPKKENPIFLFHHMSSYTPLETPYIYDLENKIATISTFNSNESLAAQKDLFVGSNHEITIFTNKAPAEFIEHPPKPLPSRPKKVAIVSNHLPDQLLELMKTLEEASIEVETFGSTSQSERLDLISPEVLAKYDLVITIGKTVQYCLCLGIPCYIYDRFGGPGYLNSENFDLALEHNFSGRGFEDNVPLNLENDILEGYSDNVEFVSSKRESHQKMFSLESSLKTLIDKLNPRDLKALDEPYKSYVKTALKIHFENLKSIGELLNSRAIDTEYILNIQKAHEELRLREEVLKDEQENLRNRIMVLEKRDLIGRIVRKVRGFTKK